MDKDAEGENEEPAASLFTPAEQLLLDNDFASEKFIKGISLEISSSLTPLRPEDLAPCEKCGVLLEAKEKQDKHMETIMESLRQIQKENATLKFQLKLGELQVEKQVLEIDELKNELDFMKKSKRINKASPPTNPTDKSKRRRVELTSPPKQQFPVDQCQSQTTHLQQITPPPEPPPTTYGSWGNSSYLMSGNPVAAGCNYSQTGAGHPPPTGTTHSSLATHPPPPVTGNPPPPTTTYYPPHPHRNGNAKNCGHHALHGIDGSKRWEGFFCICGEQFLLPALLYKHLKHILTSSAVTMSATSSSSPQAPSSCYQNNVLACSECPARLADWNAFRYHTSKSHGINTLEWFEKNDRNMNQHICPDTSNSSNQSHC